MKKYHFVFLCNKEGKNIRKTVFVEGDCIGYAFELAVKQVVSEVGNESMLLESFSLCSL
ncbi:hypothetical protein [Pseudoalteromonas nigrifaciens]|uniref:hypothetical protein n=1 Tax=Pseudoalteromonas nigrifaciens TaxID=28109 RepID=UPI003FB81B90